MRRLLSLVALAAFAGPALACDNSSELPKYEREFRSQYRDGDAVRYESPSTPVYQYLLYGGGGALLTGAVVLTLRRRVS